MSSYNQNYWKEYYLKNKDKILAKNRKWGKENKEIVIGYGDKNRKRQKEKRDERRFEVLSIYGGNPPKCKCCGETEIKFLGIDHINGGGLKHRKEIRGSIYVWLEKNNYPNGYQVLCHNCNLAKGFYDKCPHEDKK